MSLRENINHAQALGCKLDEIRDFKAQGQPVQFSLLAMLPDNRMLDLSVASLEEPFANQLWESFSPVFDEITREFENALQAQFDKTIDAIKQA